MTTSPSKGIASQEIGWSIDWAHGMGNRGFVPELEGGTGLLRLKKMAHTDETVGAMLWVMTSMIGQMPFFFAPCLNGQELSRQDPDYEEAALYAHFAQSCIDDMSHSWGDHVEEAMVMAWAGFAPCEIVFKKRDGDASQYEDGLWGFDSLPLRDPLTVWDWEVDDKNKLSKMLQRTMDGRSAEIPTWKLLHYRMSRVLDDPWGKSMLTNAWRPFFLKQRIQESEAIGIDREMAGMPTFRIPNAEIALANKTDGNGQPTAEALTARRRIQSSIDAVTKLRFNEVGGLVLPSDVFEDEDGKPGTVRKWDFSIITSAGQRSIDPRTAARDYDRAIARTVLMQFLHLGDRSGGSHGLSEDQSSMATRSLNWVAGKIAGEFNLKAMPLLWMMNAMPKAFRPKMVVGKLAEDSIEKLGQFLSDYALAEPAFATDPALRESVLDRAGLRSSRAAIRDVKPKPLQAELFPQAAPKIAPPAPGAPNDKAKPGGRARPPGK